MLQKIRIIYWRLYGLIKKEFIGIFLDPSARKILVVPLLVQSLLFGYGATFNLASVPWVLLDANKTSASAQIVRAVNNNRIFSLVESTNNLQAFESSISRGNALIGLYIPPSFSSDIQKGTANVMVIADTRNNTTANVAVGYLSAILAQINTQNQEAGPIQIVERYRYNENNITRFNIMPGLMCGLSMIQVLLLAGFCIAKEREEGTFDMMLMTPTTSIEILIGKAIPPILVGIGQAFLIFAVCRWWFDLPFAGSVWTLLAIVSLFSTCCVGIGLAISALSATIQQAMIFAFLLILPTILLSGLMTPVAAMPALLQTLTVFNPMRFAIQAIRMVYYEGAVFSDIAHLMWPMLLMGLVTMPCAVWLFRHKVK